MAKRDINWLDKSIGIRDGYWLQISCHKDNPRSINSDYIYRNNELRVVQEIENPREPPLPQGEYQGDKW